MSSVVALSDNVQVSREQDSISIGFRTLEKHSRPGNIRNCLRLACSGPSQALDLGDALFDYLVATQPLRQKVSPLVYILTLVSNVTVYVDNCLQFLIFYFVAVSGTDWCTPRLSVHIAYFPTPASWLDHTGTPLFGSHDGLWH
jgi:hypothetical protein